MGRGGGKEEERGEDCKGEEGRGEKEGDRGRGHREHLGRKMGRMRREREEGSRRR